MKRRGLLPRTPPIDRLFSASISAILESQRRAWLAGDFLAMWIDIRGQSAETLRFAFAATSVCLLAAGCARNEPPAISVGPDLNVDAGATAEMTVTVEPYGSLNVALSGTVRNHATHAPIAGVSVTVSQYNDASPHLLARTETDGDETFAVEISIHLGRLSIDVEADGYAAQSEVVTLLKATGNRAVNLDMVPVQAVREFAAEQRVDVSVEGQPVVSLPANALATEFGGSYTGQAVVSVAELDPFEGPTVMAGDFLRWDSELQSAAPIKSFGAVDVSLSGSSHCLGNAKRSVEKN